jgi:hypothetical protein
LRIERGAEGSLHQSTPPFPRHLSTPSGIDLIFDRKVAARQNAHSGVAMSHPRAA